MTKPINSTRSKLPVKFIAAGLFIVSLFPLFFVSQKQPAYDDRALLIENTFIRNSEYLQLVSEPYWAGVPSLYQAKSLYRPLFLLGVGIFKDSPTLLFSVSIAIHALCAVLCFLLLFEFFKNSFLAIGGALFFSFHPAQIEASAQIIGLMESLPTALGLGACFLWLKGKPRLAVALVSFAPGFKETGFLWLLGISVLGLSQKKMKPAALGMASIAAWIVIRIAVTGELVSIGTAPYRVINPMVKLSAVQNFFTRFELLGYQTLLSFFPFKLSSDYSLGSLPYGLGFSGIAFWIGGLTLAGMYFFRKKIPFFAWISFITLLPTLHIFGAMGIIFAERFGYAYRFFFITIIITALLFLSKKLKFITETHFKNVLGVAFLILSLIFLPKTISRHEEWKDALTLFSTDVSVFPNNPKAHFNLGMALGSLGRFPEAQPEFEKAVELAPDFPEAHFRLGLVYRQLGREDLAQRHWGIADQLGRPIRRR